MVDLGLRYQDVGGRIPHQSSQRENVESKDVHRDVILTQRAMHGLSLDYIWLFSLLQCYFLVCILKEKWKFFCHVPIIVG